MHFITSTIIYAGDFYYIIAFQDADLIYLNWRCTFSDKIIQGSLVSIGEHR